MKKIILTCLLVIYSFHFTGCLRTYYPVALKSSAPPSVFNNDEKYDKSVSHLNATYTFGKGEYDNENYYLYRLGYLISNTKKHFNFNLEGFAYTGNYKVAGLSESFDGNKSLYALGIDLSIGVNFKIDQVKFGIGSNVGLGGEIGEYYNFRRSAEDAGLISENNQPIFFMVSAYPFFNYQISDNVSLSTQVNFGIPGVISPIIQLNGDNYIVWLSWVPQNLSSEIDITERFAMGLMINLNKFSME